MYGGSTLTRTYPYKALFPPGFNNFFKPILKCALKKCQQPHCMALNVFIIPDKEERYFFQNCRQHYMLAREMIQNNNQGNLQKMVIS